MLRRTSATAARTRVLRAAPPALARSRAAPRHPAEFELVLEPDAAHRGGPADGRIPRVHAEALLSSGIFGVPQPELKERRSFSYDVAARRFVAGDSIAVPHAIAGAWPQPEVEPHVATALPGPRSKEIMDELNEIGGCGGAVNMIVDTEKCAGAYVCDADGNTFLDCFGNIASLPLGYNHPDVTAAAQRPEWQRASTHRAALGVMPPIEYAGQCQRLLEEMAPRGLDRVQTMLCGSSANENAFKAACIAYRGRQRVQEGRGAADFSAEETESAMLNQAPGAPQLTILSFEGAFHGRTLGCVSATRSKPIHKVDVPQFDWPVAPFPRLQYPLEEHEEENRAEEERCIAAVERIIAQQKEVKRDVAAVIVEPIQAEGGDNHATGHFFRRLREVTKEAGVFLIVDEVQTGVAASGTMWAHEAWDLPEDSPPDFVTFAKKAQTGGYFYRAELTPGQPYRIFNTWMGDPAKMAHLEVVLDVIKRDGLLDRTANSGALLLGGLRAVQDALPQLLSRARGQGTLCAIDCATPQQRDRTISAMRRRGMLAGACGDRSIRFRPALTFGPQHVEQALRIFADSAEEVTRGWE